MTESDSIKLLFNQLIQSENYLFPSNGNLNITNAMGVYIIFNPDGIISHVGNTRNGKGGLCQRLNNHLTGTSSFRKYFLRPRNLSVRNGYTFKFIEVPSARDRVFLEAFTCGSFCPEHIGTHIK